MKKCLITNARPFGSVLLSPISAANWKNVFIDFFLSQWNPPRSYTCCSAHAHSFSCLIGSSKYATIIIRNFPMWNLGKRQIEENSIIAGIAECRAFSSENLFSVGKPRGAMHREHTLPHAVHTLWRNFTSIDVRISMPRKMWGRAFPQIETWKRLNFLIEESLLSELKLYCES